MSGTDRLHDKVAIVTGGGDGIGRGIVRRFAREGARVLVADIDDGAGESVARTCRDELGADVRFVHTDASAKTDVTAMVATAVQLWGTVDILVNNAWGGGALGRFESMSEGQLQWALSIGLLGPIWGMQAVLPIMKAKRDGAVINLCSLNGVNAHMGTMSYNAAKEALRAASRTAAREWAPWQIRVNIICPGAKSAATRAVFAAHPELEAAADASNPMGRLGDPEDDIAPVAVFLASEDARYLTGNTLFVDGGGHINGVAWAPDLGD
jgi:NAD(P)-dependent dehydrogenase (short-subunit alcohol dehydrogenase family)